MKTVHPRVKYAERLNPEEMHESTNSWLSELKFIKEEQQFFKSLIKSYTLQLIDSKHFSESKALVARLDAIYKETTNLIEVVTTHSNDLEIMVDKVHQSKEEDTYKKEHKRLTVTLYEFFEKNKAFKGDLFNLIKGVIKEQKQKRLLK